MLSFGELKNNLKRLQDCNKAMNILTKIGWTKNALDEKQIKNQPIQFYLRIIHYILIQYSTELYKSILDLIPNIKALSDQKFVQSCFTISRKIFNINPKITADQFLQPNKLVEKKVEFIVQLCENIQQWNHNNRKKSTKDVKSTNQLRNYMQEPIKGKNDFAPYPQEQDQDQLMQRQITVAPTQYFQPLDHSFSKNQNKKTSINNQTVSITNKPNIFPKSLKNQFLQDQDQQFAQTAKFHQQKKIEPHPIKNLKQTNATVVQPVGQQSRQYITKQQFNQVLQMIGNINGTVNGLVAKFSNFQMNVTTWFNNTNARLVLLQQNVKMIKSNL